MEVPEVALQAKNVNVTGIGASAGGLEALKAFFAAVVWDSGMAFVVITHCDPTGKILGAFTLYYQQAYKPSKVEEELINQAVPSWRPPSSSRR